MTIGIYSLYWEEPDLIYIGQSQNIERRYKEHLNLLIRNKHYNYKVQEAYIKYGLPMHTVLEVCSLSELNSAEVYWTSEFNNLLNIADPGEIMSSSSSRHKKYSKIQVLRVFSYLYKNHVSIEDIALKTKVSIHTVKQISAGYKHIWLKGAYLKKYLKMLDRVPFKNNKIRSLPFVGRLISPNNTIRRYII